MPQGSRQSRKKCVTFLKGGGVGSPEKRPHDVSRRQNRYVTLPLARHSFFNKIKIINCKMLESYMYDLFCVTSAEQIQVI